MKRDFLSELNKQQQEAAQTVDVPSIILAGAGSGKTRVLVYKVFNLIFHHGIAPERILMITFTNKVANEMKERITRALAGKAHSIGFTGTFHSFCAMVLRRNGVEIGLDRDFLIYDDGDQQQLMKSILKKKSITKFTPSYFLYRISAAKNQLITPDRYLRLFSDYNAALVSEIYGAYEKELEKNKALDFDDLLVKTVQLFLRNESVLTKYQDRYRYLLVDEFQDTNYAQYMLTKLLGEKYQTATVVGDFSQNIYSWRGADIRNLEKFQEDFPKTKVFYLEENYRSTQHILDFAYKIISKNQTHPVLKLFTRNHSGEEIVIYESENEEAEALYITQEIERLKDRHEYSSMAVLYRTNAQSRIIEEVFLHYGIPYLLIGGTRFYERKEVRDVLSYLRLLVNQNDSVSVERIQKLGKRRWEEFKKTYVDLKGKIEGKTTDEIIEMIFRATHYLDRYNIDDEEDYARLENIKELKSVALSFPQLSQFLEQVALVESEYYEGEKKGMNKNGVRLMTLHQAKGLEFAVVFISGVEEGILPHSRSVDDRFQLEEERRLFYVGITRSKEKLYITHTRQRFIFGRRGMTTKSRFLQDEESDWS